MRSRRAARRSGWMPPRIPSAKLSTRISACSSRAPWPTRSFRKGPPFQDVKKNAREDGPEL